MPEKQPKKDKRRYNLTPGKQWGGKRFRAGNPKWKSGAATPIRIPEALHEAVLAYAHALDESTSSNAGNNHDPSHYQGIIQPDAQSQPVTIEDIRQMQLTLEAVRGVLEQWRGELNKHSVEMPRWRKANELFKALDTHLT